MAVLPALFWARELRHAGTAASRDRRAPRPGTRAGPRGAGAVARRRFAKRHIVNEGIASKVFATEMVGEIVNAGIQLVGGVALRDGHPLATLYRRVRAMRLAEGASDVLRLNLARGLLDLARAGSEALDDKPGQATSARRNER